MMDERLQYGRAHPQPFFQEQEPYEPSQDESTKKGPLVSILSWRKTNTTSTPKPKQWKPLALHPVTLTLALLTSLGLIASLQYLLHLSSKNGGIIFAPSVADLTFRQTFLYDHLPTIVALVFSIYWSWIDLQVKRLEPYYQLSKEGGSKAEESLLLSYPFDFLPVVPIRAVKNRHWAVFCASIAIVVVTWAIVPLQAGIFATETITRTELSNFQFSTGFIPASEQSTKLNYGFMYSSHGIIWFNETLPPYMTRDYILRPFRKEATGEELRVNETWTGKTQRYGVDLNCEAPTLRGNHEEGTGYWTDSKGCAFSSSVAELGNDTIGENKWSSTERQPTMENKEYSARFIGYYSTMASDYYLEGESCPESNNHTFLAYFTRNKKREEDPPQNVTRAFCRPFYYMQEVEAVVDAKTLRPVSYKPAGGKQELPSQMLNSSYFEYTLNEGTAPRGQSRDGLPSSVLPNQMERMSTMPVSLMTVQQMVGLSIGASNRPLEELLEPEGLESAYEAAYRILFSRAMAEVLDREYTQSQEQEGRIAYVSGVVVVVPVFTYIVEGLLGFVSICTVALLYISVTRKWDLKSDPSTIASVMSLVADDTPLLQKFSHLDCTDKKDFEDKLKDARFQFKDDDIGFRIAEAGSNGSEAWLSRDGTTDLRVEKPVRPREFGFLMVAPFILLQVGIAVTIAVLWVKSQPLGLIRPSENPVVRQILIAYIPTALATLIEPVWILINRILCMLQPLEELRHGRAQAARSIDLDYSSLPPQLVALKALRSSHFKLAAVCLMALLANILAVALSGLFDERPISVQHAAELYAPYRARFQAVNGTVGPNMNGNNIQSVDPSGAFAGGRGMDIYLSAESHYTAGTSLPQWTGERFFYVPFADPSSIKSGGVTARTEAFGAELDCHAIPSADWTLELARSNSSPESRGNVSVTITADNGRKVECASESLYIRPGPDYFIDASGTPDDCQTGRLSTELVLALEAKGSASQSERELCARTSFLAWIRYDGDICSYNDTLPLTGKDVLFMGCKPHLVAGTAEVVVDEDERIQNVTNLRTTSDLSTDYLKEHFSNDVNNVLEQANRYVFNNESATAVWHNDSYPADYVNYFIIKDSNDSSLVDASKALPTFEEAVEKLDPLYSQLFAMWLGLNRDRLLLPNDKATPVVVRGRIIEEETRIFLSRPLFIVAEVILFTYALVAFVLYLWRPGKFLARLPTCIAAVIALFAASAAVRDMEGTSCMEKKRRKEHVRQLGYRYGYGTFLGARGKVHIGIEKEPLVKYTPVPGVLERVQTGLSKRGRKGSDKFPDSAA